VSHPDPVLQYSFLARGAHGELFAGARPDGSPVVLKVRSLAQRGDWAEHEWFARSARLLVSLEHPGLVRAHAFHHDTDRSVLVLERLEGGTLHTRVTRERARFGLPFLRALLEPLAFLHARGLVHRDITPFHVMFRDGAPVLVGCDALAESGTLDDHLGTPGFVAPEQVGGPATPASDVYGAAATALFAATGIDVDGHARRRGRLDLSRWPSLARVLGPMLALDARERPPNAGAALRLLDSPPEFSKRPLALVAVAIAIVGATVHPARTPMIDPASPLACRIATDPPGATVFVGDSEQVWNEEHPLESSLGRTPLIVLRNRAHPLVLHKDGYRPFVLEVAEGEGDCAFTAKLVAK